ncbi:MAG: hypothetical protein AABW51_02180 [Nanoarchaeota archaeon]
MNDLARYFANTALVLSGATCVAGSVPASINYTYDSGEKKVILGDNKLYNYGFAGAMIIAGSTALVYGAKEITKTNKKREEDKKNVSIPNSHL